MKGSAYPIGKRLRQARLERNLTLEKLSRTAKVPPSTIWKYENEQVDYSFFTVLKLASALGKNFRYILGLGENGAEDVVLAGPEDGVSCEVRHERWRLDLYNRRLAGRWMVNGILRLYPGARLIPRKNAGEEMFLRCLEGLIEIRLAERQYLLSEGYSMQFRADEEIMIGNRGERMASAEISATRLLFVI